MRTPALTILFVLLLPALRLAAQDSLWVRRTGDGASFVHSAKSGETLFMLAKRYSVPPALLADVNGLSYAGGLSPGSKLSIPVGAFNLLPDAQEGKSRPLYYKTGDGDKLADISRLAGIAQSTMQRRNGMDNQELAPGQTLLLGWVSFDKQQTPFARSPETAGALPHTSPLPAAGSTAPATPVNRQNQADTAGSDALTAFGILYGEQTEGVSLSEETGAAVFYPLRAKAATGVYYAFHNTALRGTILKVSNPANGKVVYAKVIGPVPALKEYHNCILGLSDNAAAALGAREKRMFCNISYR